MRPTWSGERLPVAGRPPRPGAAARRNGQVATGPVRPGAAARVRDLLALVRPGQWVKNLLVVCVPLVDQESWSLAGLAAAGWAVVAFTVASALVYVVNDIADRHRDRAHPTKRHRPVAAGRIPVPAAALLAVVLAGLLAGVLSRQPWTWSWPVFGYLVLATGYSVVLKHVPLVDVFVVAAGFGLRLMQGYVAIGTEASGWLLTCVFSLCLLLTVGKRRQELATTGGAHRPALRGYTVGLTDQLMVLCAVLTAGAYLLYLRTEAPLGGYATPAAVLSAPLALFALFRYLQLVLVHERGENPARMLLRDPPLVVNALLWVALSGGFLLAARLSPPA